MEFIWLLGGGSDITPPPWILGSTGSMGGLCWGGSAHFSPPLPFHALLQGPVQPSIRSVPSCFLSRASFQVMAWRLASFQHQWNQAQAIRRNRWLAQRAHRRAGAALGAVRDLAVDEDNASEVEFARGRIGPLHSAGTTLDSATNQQCYVVPFGNIPLGLDHGERGTTSIMLKKFDIRGLIEFPYWCFTSPTNGSLLENTCGPFSEQDVVISLWWETDVVHGAGTTFVGVNTNAVTQYNPANCWVDCRNTWSSSLWPSAWWEMNKSQRIDSQANTQRKLIRRMIVRCPVRPNVAEMKVSGRPEGTLIGVGAAAVPQVLGWPDSDAPQTQVLTPEHRSIGVPFRFSHRWRRGRRQPRQEFDDAGVVTSNGHPVVTFHVRQMVETGANYVPLWGQSTAAGKRDVVSMRCQLRRWWDEPRT